MARTEMLVNYVPGEECRIAIVRGGRLEEFYQERASTESHVGNIYKGRVLNVEPSIQAAFVDFGLERNGFLHVTDLHPMYFPGKDREEFEQVGSKTPHRERPPIQKCLKRGQEILVQVLKEGIGTKGPTLTSYLSIPGRFLVMMPHMQRLGVTRKVEDEDERRESKKLLEEIKPPEGFGFIVRTAGVGQNKTDLKRDLAYLQRLWKNIEGRRKRIGKVGELYTESDLVIRTIRDVFSNDIERVIVDERSAARRARDFLGVASPRARSRVVFYDDPVPLFDRFGIEEQIESIHAREVPLESGGSLVIDPTEALVAIDVNSGKSRDAKDAESNAFNTNREAVEEIARQLRLRDLGGVVVLDLIDMRDQKHRRQIEQKFRQAIKTDRARTRVGSISQFGILELTRQRMRPSLRSSSFGLCPHCGGTGHVKSPESVVLDVMRRLALALQSERVARVDLTIGPDVAFQLLNRKRRELSELERRAEKSVTVRVGGHTPDYVFIQPYDERGGTLELEAVTERSQFAAETERTYRDLAEEGETLEAEERAEAERQTEEAEFEAELEPESGALVPTGDAESAAASVQAGEDQEGGEEDGGGRRKRRRRRRGRGGRSRGRGEDQEGEGASEETAGAEDAASSASSQGGSDSQAAAEEAEEPEGGGAKKTKSSRKRGRSSRNKKKTEAQEQAEEGAPSAEPAGDSEAEGATAEDANGSGEGGSRRRRRGGRKRRSSRSANGEASSEGASGGEASSGGEGGEQPVGGYKNRLISQVSRSKDDEAGA